MIVWNDDDDGNFVSCDEVMAWLVYVVDAT